MLTIEKSNRIYSTMLLLGSFASFLIVAAGCAEKDQGKNEKKLAGAANSKTQIEKIIELRSAKDFDGLVSTEIPVLVDFYAEWCGPCHMLKPILKEIADEYEGKIKVVAVDIDKFRNLAGQYKVNSIPDVRLFKNGKIENSFVGVLPKEEFVRAINLLQAY